ncbi:hypothetical protein CLV68_2646 [Actinokineospora cianjurensis]|uniref:Uncharacterized protein n=1 Tax=Actinokineospora cianjurensis TaxID=585224 RepID=A0A421BCM9_9PSEU|nr:hypothetical protein CLV68_2646 [Actinokineospora cianjurensis]
MSRVLGCRVPLSDRGCVRRRPPWEFAEGRTAVGEVGCGVGMPPTERAVKLPVADSGVVSLGIRPRQVGLRLSG